MLNLTLSLTLMRMMRLHEGSSSGLWKSLTYGCCSASVTEMRLLGLKDSILLSRSIASLLHLPWNSFNPAYVVFRMLSSSVVANVELTASISCFEGWPITLMTFSIWFKVEVPGKIGFPIMSSPKMHPHDHMSTALD